MHYISLWSLYITHFLAYNPLLSFLIRAHFFWRLHFTRVAKKLPFFLSFFLSSFLSFILFISFFIFVSFSIEIYTNTEIWFSWEGLIKPNIRHFGNLNLTYYSYGNFGSWSINCRSIKQCLSTHFLNSGSCLYSGYSYSCRVPEYKCQNLYSGLYPPAPYSYSRSIMATRPQGLMKNCVQLCSGRKSKMSPKEKY